MTSGASHLDSGGLASAAHDALRAGKLENARALFADAARAEVGAFAVSEDKPRTLGILAVSAAALWFKAGDLQAAELLAHRALAKASLPSFARQELRGLLRTIWIARGDRVEDEAPEPGQNDLEEVVRHCLEARRLSEDHPDKTLSFLLEMAIEEARDAMRPMAAKATRRLRDAS